MKEDMIWVNYWTGMMRCGCGEVGGKIKVQVSPEEKAYLESARGRNYQEFSDELEEEHPELWKRIHDLAADDLDRQMAEDAMYAYDFDDEEFEGWTYEQKLEYVRNDKDPDTSIDDICTLMFEMVDEE